MPKDLYKDFAKSYDRFKNKFNEHDPVYAKFFDTIFKKNKISSILDCACGTGNDLHLFHSLGYDVVGSDISKSMLAQAKKNLTEFDKKIPLYRVDYRSLHEYFKQHFDAVVCLSSSILHMTSNKQVIQAFKSMYKVLSDQGVLILSQGTTDKQWKKKSRFILAVNNKDFSRLFVIDYKQKGARYNVLDIYHNSKKSKIRVWSVEYPQMLLKDDYQILLKLTGFRKVDFYGSYHFEPYNKRKSDFLIVVAHK
jgi:glycine/sarcosine N-methyltransferase